MEILTSKIHCASGRYTCDVFRDALSECSVLKIATGYITSDSVIELKKILENNRNPRIDLFIGMHYFDLFTKAQYGAVSALNETLLRTGRGKVYLSPKVRFHGKMYAFVKNDHCFSAVIGSSNLGSFTGVSNDMYEIDCAFDDSNETSKVANKISKIITDLGEDFSNVRIDKFKIENKILEGHYGVENIGAQVFQNWASQKVECSFLLPLKTEPKSNLNAFFGKGRKNQRNFEMPRPWYEVEIIVSKNITSLAGYPANSDFKVITSDGYSFMCSTNGASSKNFRSYDDLKILGKWIKGTMEEYGALKVGTPVTNDVLEKFGSKNLRLTKIEGNDVWLLEFAK